MIKKSTIAFFGCLFFLSLLACLAIGSTPLAADPPKTPFTAIIAFGDSLSDNGYADGHGFKRYTETLTWVEQLADLLGLPLEDRAWGGAMSDKRNCNHAEGVEWSGFLWQVEDYLKSLKPGQDISSILFTVMVGSNDVWYGIEDGAVSAENIKKGIEMLAAKGAKHILYRETMTVLLAPGYLAGDYLKYAEPWTKLVEKTNGITKEQLSNGLVAYPDLSIYYHETNPIMEKIKAGQKGFKFEIIDKPWWGTYTLPEPYKYLWYDEWHPMGQLHKIIAEDSLAKIIAQLK
ncbi:MAG: GDSL-type esterase/lipase family protein [Deltaproteobacteria bacterium]|jgi:lysophospholipase L1-like esterase|nr:GDSL-type esterase/lipase family protein [Deltaproteobacteria bacterium]